MVREDEEGEGLVSVCALNAEKRVEQADDEVDVVPQFESEMPSVADT